jgi:hypothetical protein
LADQRITELTLLTRDGIGPDDVLPIVDLSASETKKVTVKDLVGEGVDLINDGEIDLAKLDQGSVTKLGTAALANGAITAAKLAADSSVAVEPVAPVTDNFEGRGFFNAGTGNFQIFNGSAYQQVVMPTAGIGDLQVTTGKLADGAVTTAKVTSLGTAAYADASVTTAKLADQSVTAAKIATDSITAAQIAPNAVGASELADNSVDTAAIQDLSITEGKLAGGAVTTGKLGDAAVTGAKIADATIDYTKLSLADGSVPGAKITDASVTYAKLNLADGSVPGAKITAGSVAAAQLGVDAVETSKLADSAVTTAKVADGAITAAKIAADSITAAQIAPNAVGASELSDDAVDTAAIQNLAVAEGKIAAGAVTTSKLADGAVTAAKIAADSITNAQIGPAAVETSELADAAVTTAKVADGAITTAKIAADSITAAQIAPDAVGASELADNAVDSAAIQALAVTEAKLAGGAVVTAKLADGAVTGAKVADATLSYAKLDLADGSVPGAKIAADSITAAQIAPDAVATSELATGAVTTAKVADGAITAAKIAADSITASQIAPDAVGASELADDAVATASIQDLAVTEGKLAGGAVSAAKLVDGAVTTAKLADGAITAAKLDLADGSVSGAKLASGSITGTQIAATTVTAGNLADASVTTAKLADGAVTGAKIAAETITASQLADGAVGTSELATAAVTYDKLQPTASDDVLLGRGTGAGGTVEEIALTAAGRALLDDADAGQQRETLGLGNIALASGTWVDGSSFSGTSSGTNTGDQTITLTGDVTGSGTGAFATLISEGAVNSFKLAADAVTTGKIANDAVTAGKLADNSAAIVQTALPTGNGEFIGQQWLNVNDALEYTWTGTEWLRQAGLGALNIIETTPLTFAVVYPDPYTADISVTLDTQGAATVFAGPLAGDDAAPTFRALAPSDLPLSTATTKGIIQPGTGLAVTDGVLDHVNAITGATVSGITFDAQGHISAAIPLVPGDIPELDAAKITSGELPTDRIADGAITAAKMANYATAQIGETLPQATFIGEIFFNPLDKAFFLWDGNVWQPIGISAGAIVFAGTYDASVNQVASVTTEGAAIGLSVGDALPAASNTNANYYLVVSIGGTGTAPAPTVALAPPDLLLSNGATWIEIDVSSTYTAQTASNIAFSPAGQVGSTNVQAAIEEVSSECRNASNLTSGTLAAARGGTGTGSYTKGDLLAASGAADLSKLGVGTNGQVLTADSGTATGLVWATPTVGTVTTVTSSTAALTVANASTTPALTIRSATTAVNGIVQLSSSINSTSTTLAATASAVKSAYDLANAALPLAGGTMTGQLLIGTAGSLVFEGATNDANKTTLAVADPTASRTITLPNLSGTVALTSDLDDGAF